MAENKKSFVLYADLIHTVEKMPKAKQAELFLTILKYVNDQNPVVDDLIVSLVFEPIKLQLKRDLERWERFREKQAENGRQGGRPRKEKTEEENPNNPGLFQKSQKSLNATANANVISLAGAHDESKIYEYLRSATDRQFITDEQVRQEAQDFKTKYDGSQIKNLRTLCNTWASNIKPWQKKGMVI